MFTVRGFDDVDVGHTFSHSVTVTETHLVLAAGLAYLAAMLAGKPLDGINEHANRLAGYVCTQAGGTPGIPDELASS